MSTHKKLITVAAVATLAFGLAACGDNDNGPSTMMDDMPAMDLAWDMLDGETVEPGTYAISSAPADLLDDAADIVVPEGGFVPGSMVELGGYVLTCSGTVNCSVTVDDEDNVMTTGTIMVMAKMDTVDPVDPVDPVVPVVPTPVAVTLPADLPETLPPAEGEIMIAAGMSEESGGVMFSCATDGEACVVTVDADGMATSMGGTVTATLTMAAQEVVDAEKLMADQMMRDRGIGQSAALAGGGGDALAMNATGFDVGDLTISNAATKDTSVSVTGYTAAEMAAMANGTWSGHALVNTSSTTSTQHLVVYTDIEDPKRRQFFDFDMDTDTPRAYDRSNTGDIALVPGTTALVEAQGRFSAGNIDLTIFPAKGPASGGTVTKTFTANTVPVNAANTVVSLPGTFDGARGKYSCTGTQTNNTGPYTCVVTVTPAGTYGTANAWAFTPNTGEMAYHEDSEYVTFGWWMREPAKSTGAYSFAAFYSGSDYVVSGSNMGAEVEGAATYTGNAAGRYVMGNEAGAFTASASLSANFGGPAADAAMNVGSISGSITGFQGDAGGMSGWMVELKKINLSDLATPAAAPFQTSVPNPNLPTYNGTVATLGAVTAHGSWQGQFYGNAKNPDMPGMNSENAQPLAVGGMFNADGAGANIVGAFGARRP